MPFCHLIDVLFSHLGTKRALVCTLHKGKAYNNIVKPNQNDIVMKVAVRPQNGYAFQHPFDNLVKNFFNADLGFGPFREEVQNFPAVNVVELEDQFRIELAAPGLSKEDFKIELDQNRLSIAVEKQMEKVEGEQLRRREFSYASFKRNFGLPKSVDAEHIAAKYEQGVLSLTLPKKAEALPKPARTIEIG
jgi:HSP20 family protein